MWPHHDAVAKRAAQLITDYRQGMDIAKFTTNGTEDKRVVHLKTTKQESPTKGAALTGSSNFKQQSST